MTVLDVLLEAFQTPAMKAAQANAAKRAAGGDRLPDASASRAYDEKKHKRGEKGTSEGGKFVSKGSSGAEVRTVQQRVGAKADGQFGMKTTQAVRDFQRRHRLVVDGKVGHQTALALAGKFHAARSAKVGELRDTDREALKGSRGRPGKPGKSGAPRRARGGAVVG